MATRKKPDTSIFDIGFPITSRVGMQRVDQMIGARLDSHTSRIGKVANYFNAELSDVANGHEQRLTRVMRPLEQELDRLRGSQDVRNAAVQGALAMALAPIQGRAERITEPQSPFHPETLPGVPGCAPTPNSIAWTGPFPATYPGRPEWRKSSETAVQAVYRCHGSGGIAVLSHAPPVGGGGGPPSLPVGGGNGQPISGPPVPPIGEPPPPICPHCGCTLEWPADAPGSSCERPLYIVVCVPAPKPEFCPAPPPGGVTGGRGVPYAGPTR